VTTPRHIPLEELNEEQLAVLREFQTGVILNEDEDEPDIAELATIEVPVRPHLRRTKRGIRPVIGYEQQRKKAELPFKVNLGTLHPDDQPVARAALERFNARYPEAAKLITKVGAAKLTTRWGQFRKPDGVMKFTNLGRDESVYYRTPEGERRSFRDPELPVTVAHESGHALLWYLAGGRVMEIPKRLTREQRMRISPFEADARRTAISAYNMELRAQQQQVDEIVRELKAQISERFDGNARAVADNIMIEFSRNPGYVLMNPEELIVQAFGHWENGMHGPIADLIGPLLEERYRLAATQDAVEEMFEEEPP
jgi:hypothetical protein